MQRTLESIGKHVLEQSVTDRSFEKFSYSEWYKKGTSFFWRILENMGIKGASHRHAPVKRRYTLLVVAGWGASCSKKTPGDFQRWNLVNPNPNLWCRAISNWGKLPPPQKKGKKPQGNMMYLHHPEITQAYWWHNDALVFGQNSIVWKFYHRVLPTNQKIAPNILISLLGG